MVRKQNLENKMLKSWFWAGNISSIDKCLLSLHKALGGAPGTTQTMKTQPWNSGSWEVVDQKFKGTLDAY